MWRFAAVAVIALGASACGSTTTTSTSITRTPSVAVPAGWKTYTYGRAVISVPADWTVVSKRGCSSSSAAGVLALGVTTSVANCPEGTNSVVVSSLSAGDQQAMSLCPASRVNGLVVHVLPCASSRPAGIVQYLVPALGIEAVGTAPSGETISGGGTNSVVSQVLATLR